MPLGRHIRLAGVQLIQAALTKHALELSAPSTPHATKQTPTSPDPTAAPAMGKVVATPPVL